MKKLIIICEGQTEQAFCDKILKSHFSTKEIEIEYPLILHSGGGIVPWRFLKQQIDLHIETEPSAYITTFIDYYGIYNHHVFPEWEKAHVEDEKAKRMAILEAGMLDSLERNIQNQFIPNIQLHEFEALVLSDRDAFDRYYSQTEMNLEGLNALCALMPETINDGKETAPSKRLESFIPIYNKVSDGPELTQIIGLEKIRAQCPRFNNWIKNLEEI